VTDEASPLVDDEVHAGLLVEGAAIRLERLRRHPVERDQRIDLDRSDVAASEGAGEDHVVTPAGTDDQDLAAPEAVLRHSLGAAHIDVAVKTLKTKAPATMTRTAMLATRREGRSATRLKDTSPSTATSITVLPRTG
jgi:hypothetical protein